MATVGATLTQLRDRLDESSARMWTDAMLRRWLLEGARDIARRTECLRTRSTLAAVAGTQEYDLDDDIVRIYRVEFTPTGQSQIYVLEYRDFNTMDEIWWTGQATGSGTPVWFTMWGFPPALRMVVYPTPSTAGTFKFFFYKLPTAFLDDGTDDSDTVDLPSGWEDVMVDYAEYVALRRDSDQRWNEAKGLYEARLADLYVTAIRWTDQMGTMSSSGAMVPRWLSDEGY